MPFAEFGDFEDCVEQNQDKDSPEGFCAWLQHETTGEWPSEKEVKKAMSSKEVVENILSGPIVLKNNEKKIVTAPVLIPGEQDADGEVVTAEKIEEVALKFLEEYAIVDVGHTFNQVAIPVENWVTREDTVFNLPDGKMLFAPKGTWMLSAKIQQDNVWKGIMAGKYTGFSVTGVRKADITRGALKEVAIGKKTKTLLQDLGEDWVAVTVSIVENPAVYKSKWIAIKEREKDQSRIMAGVNKILAHLGIKEDEQGNTRKETEEMTEEQIKALVNSAVKEALSEVSTSLTGIQEAVKSVDSLVQRVTALEASVKGSTETEDTQEETSTQEEGTTTEETLTDAKDEGEPAIKEQIRSLTKQVEDLVKKFAPKSKAITGQDGEDNAEKDAGDGRDFYGRKIRK